MNDKRHGQASRSSVTVKRDAEKSRVERVQESRDHSPTLEASSSVTRARVQGFDEGEGTQAPVRGAYGTSSTPHVVRPNKVELEQTLRSLALCYIELSLDIDRKGDQSSGSSSKTRLPVNETVIDAMRDIEHLAYTWRNRFREDDPRWEPPPLAQGVAGVLLALAERAGHFTHHEDPKVAFEFAEDVETKSERAWEVARPGTVHWHPIARDCEEDDCPGMYHVLLDTGRSSDAKSLRDWRPTAVCHLKDDQGKWRRNSDHAHRVDAKLLMGAEWSRQVENVIAEHKAEEATA